MMPRNTAIGVIVGGLAFALGFAMIWHIWWLAIGSALAILAPVTVRSFQDEIEYRLPASEVAAIEDRRLEALARSPRRDFEEISVLPHRPLPRGAT
jgi:cytochrome o ubiquinol oxidase subunit 1